MHNPPAPPVAPHLGGTGATRQDVQACAQTPVRSNGNTIPGANRASAYAASVSRRFASDSKLPNAPCACAPIPMVPMMPTELDGTT